MNLSAIHNIYFIGIGGIGMSALARYFAINGKNVMGFDKVQTTITNALEQIGVGIPSNLNTYGLRKSSPSERLKLVEYAIENTPNLGLSLIHI